MISADPVSIASVLAFIGASKDIIAILRAMKSAKKEEGIMVQEFIHEIKFLETLGRHLKKLMEDEPNAGSITSSSAFTDLMKYMEDSRVTLVSVLEKYNAVKPSKIRRFLRRTTWHFRKEDLEELLSKIRHCKLSITNALDVCQIETLRTIMIEQTQAQVREEFMKWLNPGSWDIDYAANVEQSRINSLTTNKILNALKDSHGELRFYPCESSKERNAIFASLITALRAELGGASNTAIAYYSFPHNRSTNGSAPMISALIAQMCRGLSSVPTEVITLFKENSTQSQRSPELLFKIFKILSRRFQRIHILLNTITKDAGEDIGLLDFKKRMELECPTVSGFLLIRQEPQPLPKLVKQTSTFRPVEERGSAVD
ncbi:hypothetical protein M422DRAFT_253612 [Sphaerobolus stellatus SS14]|uniref:Uncharacterized protein n=1 Tax=Sphaerobolus stellatus (strain SS14) TaxID=990650 RepID=A0A0C9VWF0_SPHS4|nr:hypothetical protein M422DRAFT_253612 [Sphaerobolus stellatus SS14]